MSTKTITSRTYRMRIIRQGSGMVRYVGSVQDLEGSYIDLASALAAAVDTYGATAHRIEVRAQGGQDVGQWTREGGAAFIVYYGGE